MTITIDYTPVEVSVRDARLTVPGARITVTYPDGTKLTGDVIPPEGDAPECWLGELSGVESELWDSLEVAAREGSAGRSGQYRIDD